MSLLFESIACYNDHLLNIDGHEKRLNSSRKELLKSKDAIKLDTIQIPAFAKDGLWKCRVSYDYEIDKIEFTEYNNSPPQTFRLVESTIKYPFKYDDRIEINSLVDERGPYDDVIIVIDNMITDTSTGNVVFNDGNRWVTPANPLLEGTMRAQLLEMGTIRTRFIRKENLSDYESFMMINALNPFDQNRALSIKNIGF